MSPKQAAAKPHHLYWSGHFANPALTTYARMWKWLLMTQYASTSTHEKYATRHIRAAKPERSSSPK